MRRSAVMLAAAALAVVAGTAHPRTGGAQTPGQLHPLSTLPLDDPAYVQLDGLQRSGCAAARVSPFRPYLVRDLSRALREAARSGACAGPLLEALTARFQPDSSTRAAADSAAAPTDSTSESDAQRLGLSAGAAATLRATARRDQEFLPLWRDVRPDSAGDPNAVGIVRGRLRWDGGERLAAVVEGFAQTDRRNDPSLRGRGFRSTDAVVDFSEAYINGRLGPLVVSLGRSDEAWLGEGRESLALSAYGPPLDRVSAQLRWSRFEARALFGTLNDVTLDETLDALEPGTGAQRLHRMISAHALSFRPRPGWDFTLGETAVITRRGGGVDLSFANPLMVFVVTENDTSRTGGGRTDDNLGAFGAAHITVGRASMAAELFIDDIQIDPKDRERIPDQLGLRLAGDVGLPTPLPASAGLEYTHVNSYTYLRRNYAEVYQSYDQPLGSMLGPDADLARARAELWLGGRVRLSGSLGRWRRGAQRLEERPGRAAEGHAGEPFPSVTEERPAVQRAWLGDAALEFLHGVVPVSARLTAARFDNVNNQPATPANLYRVQFVGSYRFRYP